MFNPEIRKLCTDGHPEKEFIDLVRVFPSLTEANYEGICW